jgi:hypothetical protein
MYLNAFSAGETIFFRERTFANPQYTIQAIAASQEQVDMIRNFCLQASQMHIPFDKVGMYGVHLAPSVCRAIKSMHSAFQGMKILPNRERHSVKADGCGAKYMLLRHNNHANNNNNNNNNNHLNMYRRNHWYAGHHNFVEDGQITSSNNMAHFCIEEEDDFAQSVGKEEFVGMETCKDASMKMMLHTLQKEGAFCSKYIVCALQYAGIYGFHDMDANKASPSSLYHRIMQPDYQNVIGGLVTAVPPFRQKLLQQTGKVTYKE